MKKKKINLSVVVIAKNEEKKLPGCLKSVAWADKVILVDTGSTDKTVEIAKKEGAVIYTYTGGSYNDWRNKGLKEARGRWLLYIDADERVSKGLKNEIKGIVSSKPESDEAFGAYAIPRRNIILGKEMKHGGWWPDYVKRLFVREKLSKWVGKLHEEPEFKGLMGHLRNPLIHKKHSNLKEMVDKSNKWSEIEAELLYETNHPKMAWWRFIRVMFSELWLRLICKGGILDGPEGVIYAFYQMWSKFITYAKLWEMQLDVGNSKKD